MRRFRELDAAPPMAQPSWPSWVVSLTGKNPRGWPSLSTVVRAQGKREAIEFAIRGLVNDPVAIEYLRAGSAYPVFPDEIHAELEFSPHSVEEFLKNYTFDKAPNSCHD